jgi:hypothetical protein
VTPPGRVGFCRGGTDGDGVNGLGVDTGMGSAVGAGFGLGG